MTRFALHAALQAIALFAILAIVPLSANAAGKNLGGDGSGIGGTGNSPSGGGIGGTGTREQNSPSAMPDLPDRPETVEVPAIEPPDLPTVDLGAPNGAADMPAPPDDIVPASPPAQP